MYAILVSIALAAYSLVLLDFTMLFHEMSANADMISSTQALYTAESVADYTFLQANSNHPALNNKKFIAESAKQNYGDDFLYYNEGIQSSYINRNLSLKAEDLSIADSFVDQNRVIRQDTYKNNKSILDPNVLYALEPKKSASYVIRETKSEDSFNTIVIEYNTAVENSDLLFEVFSFPREGSPVKFLDFKSIKEGQSQSVEKMAINTKDQSTNFLTAGSQNFSVQFINSSSSEYKNKLVISGFNPFYSNYQIRFQTLNNSSIHYKIYASANGFEKVFLPGIMQTVDVIGVTPTALFQRVKIQRQTEEALQPGLNFVHFSNTTIHK